MKQQIFKGAGCAIATPFLEDGNIHFEEFGRLIDFQINNGTDSIIVMGTTGEASALYDDAHIAAIDYCVKRVAGRIPVIAGCGSNHTIHAVKLSQLAEACGADALLHVTPYYNKTTQAGLVTHFATIAKAVSIPIILYNVPSRTGMTIEPETYQKLAKISNIVATKEASGDISLIAKIAALCGDNLAIYSGNDDQILPVLAYGGLGVISVLSNIIPEKIHLLCHSYFQGELDTARSIQLDILELNDAMFCEVNPIPVKEALNQMGFAMGAPLLPLVEPSTTSKAKITAALKQKKIIE